MRRLLNLALALGLVAAACSPSSSSGATSTSTDDTPTSQPATTTTSSAGAGGPDCLVGTWVLDTDSFVEALAEAYAESGIGVTEVTAGGGSFTMTLDADGSMESEREEWGFGVVMAEGTFNIVIDGRETGTWSADDSTMTVDTTDSDLSVSATVEADGQSIDIPSSPVEVPDTIASDSEYSCEGDVLTVVNDGFTSVMNRS